jgi:tetratricopeptide (TPR) repeat protein
MDQWDRADLLHDAIEASQGINRDPFRLYNAGTRGALKTASRYLDSLNISSGVKGIYLGHANHVWGWTPEGEQAALMNPGLCTEDGVNPACHLFMGGLFVREGLRTETRATVASLRAEADRRLGEDPDAAVETLLTNADFIDAYESFHDGEIRGPKSVFQKLATRADFAGAKARLALGELEASEGHLDEAIRHYEASLHAYHRPLAILELARLHEAAGRTTEALSYWERVLVSTRSGDQDLAQVTEAREAVARLAQ